MCVLISTGSVLISTGSVLNQYTLHPTPLADPARMLMSTSLNTTTRSSSTDTDYYY